jgi:hypothetical protein
LPLLSWKYVTCFFTFYRDSQINSLPWVSEETLDLDFSIMLELLKLWGSKEMEWIYFALWDRHGPFMGQRWNVMV